MAASSHPEKLCPRCQGICDIRQVKKEGANNGKWFYTCKGYSEGGNCSAPKGYFEWIAPPEEEGDQTFASSKRPRPAQSTSSSLPRQTQHVTKEMCDQATLGSIWTTLKQIEGRLITMEQKQDFILARLRERDEQDDEPPASQAQ